MSLHFNQALYNFFNRHGFGMRAKLIIIFLLVKVIPLIVLTVIAWTQFTHQGEVLSSIAVDDSSAALNDSAVENIERMSTTAAERVAEFLYGRDDDLIYLSHLPVSEQPYRNFIEHKTKRIIDRGQWKLASDDKSWEPMLELPSDKPGFSTNPENNDMDGFHPQPAPTIDFNDVPLYDEITFVDLNGQEQIKIVSPGSTKKNYPLNPEKKDVSKRENTYVKAETYFDELKNLKPGEIYVSDVIGAYVPSNFIGMYTPDVLAKASADRGYEIPFLPEQQAYSGKENPIGQHFEGIIRWATPVTNENGEKIGYITLALNHDHIMEFVDHITPMNERYTQQPSAFEGNYAFIWDYKCRNIVHPRHHSIVGFDPETGLPQVPWLETSIYEGWQASGLENWTEYVKDYPIFHEQSRTKKPAPILTKTGMVGLDGRYLNNAPQCIGWMDLTANGGSGSFYILWSGLYKLNTAAAIPYYTGHYAPSKENGYSKRGFGFVTIGSEREYFTRPARETEAKLHTAVEKNLSRTFLQLITTTFILIILVVFIAIWMASFLTKSITHLISGISRFRSGERQFRFNAPIKDEFGTLADSFDDMADSLAYSIKNPLCIINEQRNIIYANETCLELLGKTLPEIVGIPYGDLSIYPPGSKYCPITALEEEREPETYYVESTKRYVKGSANYFVDKDGHNNGYIVETVDVTEMILRQLEIEDAMNAANRANQHKGEFLANMSHEIRTPMNAIIGLSSIVLKNLDSVNNHTDEFTEIKDNIKQIESSSLHLLGLLNDILDLSKIEAGKIELADEVVELMVLANTVTSIMKMKCMEKHINFITDFDSFKPSTFRTDPLHLRQVLINLLGNAVKFTPEKGAIHFCIKQKDSRPGEVLVEFKVKDSGIGISDEAKAGIFQAFEQGGGKITRQYGGTGLGLTISRHIVQMFGGDITVISEVGKGSDFSFQIWMKISEEAIQTEPQALVADPTGKLVGKRVLLVDDVDLNRKIVKAMLKITGITIEEAEDGSTALKAFDSSSENTFDIILMDVQMPIMDGYQAAAAIRELDRKDNNVPIIALTANAFKDDIDKALAAGMNAHLPKPVKQDKLLEAMFKYIMAPDKTKGIVN